MFWRGWLQRPWAETSRKCCRSKSAPIKGRGTLALNGLQGTILMKVTNAESAHAAPMRQALMLFLVFDVGALSKPF
jgi:hypothetical protein